jgi:hypothetical protein
MTRVTLILGVLLVSFGGFVSSASATVLTFDINNTAYPNADPVSPNFPEGFQISLAASGYGDNVSSSPVVSGTSTFSYGVGSEGFTPNVTADYGPSSIFTGGPELWRYDYGDLVRVLYQGSRFGVPPIGNNYNILDITLTADPGYAVVLYGFDLGGWNKTNYTIDEVAVFKGIPFPFLTPTNQISDDFNVDVLGAGPAHTSFDFSATPLRGTTIVIRIDASNLGDVSEFIGIDNIRFGQDIATPADAVVPEPASLIIWTVGGGAGVLAFIRRRRRKGAGHVRDAPPAIGARNTGAEE